MQHPDTQHINYIFSTRPDPPSPVRNSEEPPFAIGYGSRRYRSNRGNFSSTYRIGVPGTDFRAGFDIDVTNTFYPFAKKEPAAGGGGGHSALDYAGLLAGGADTYFGLRGEAVHNSMYWVQKNGTVRLASAANSNVLYKNSYKVVGNLTSASKIASASFAGVGTVISGVQFVSNSTYANAFDAAMGLTSFIPVAGWAISGTYFIANIGCQLITEKTLGQQIFGGTKVY